MSFSALLLFFLNRCNDRLLFHIRILLFVAGLVMVQALQLPCAQSDVVFLKHGLLAISTLAAGNPANRAQLGELGACAGECML